MEVARIAIIDDDPLIVESLSAMVSNMGYIVEWTASGYSVALRKIEATKPGLALVDIMLDGLQDGLLLGNILHSKYNLPFVYITSLNDKETVDKARYTCPSAYIIKPFGEEDLYATLEIALYNSKSKNLSIDGGNKPLPSVFVKDEHNMVKLAINDIIYLKSEGNYVKIFMKDKNHLVRSPLKDVLAMLPASLFFQVHKSYAINIDHVHTINCSHVYIGGSTIPLSRSFRDVLLEKVRAI